LYDGEGAPVPDAVLEIWQADAAGQYNYPAGLWDSNGALPAFTGFGRCGTDDHGMFSFETIKPGAVPFEVRPGVSGARMQAPHICVAVLARGLLNHLFTRLYFADEVANSGDPILNCVPKERRDTLMARPMAGKVAEGITEYNFDVVLQGANETVFFNL
jgi:protocatechuate 3,4-dioxygenase alpha subunit